MDLKANLCWEIQALEDGERWESVRAGKLSLSNIFSCFRVSEKLMFVKVLAFGERCNF